MKYRSKIEGQIHKGRLSNWDYEDIILNWIDNKGKSHKYTGDFVNKDRTKIVEVKGYFRKGDRTKYKTIQKQNQDIELIFAFQDYSRKIKGSNTTYAKWCKKNGFTFYSWEMLTTQNR